MRLIGLTCMMVLALLASSRIAAAQENTNWPQWRGPHLDGHSDEKNLPVTWSRTEGVVWKVSVPGSGHSSPIVWDDRIFLTTCIEKELKRELLCIGRADGKILWEKTVLTAPLERKNTLNSYATGTPATDGKHIYAAFYGSPDIWIVCYDLDGNEVWRKSPGQFTSMHGWGCGPILYKDMVVLNCDQDAPRDQQAFIVALDKATGAERWRVDRPNRVRSYCIPLIVQAAGKMQLVLTGSRCVASYDPDTGKQHWLIDGPTEQFVASPVFADETIFITGGFPQLHLLGIRPDGSGNVTQTHILWHQTKGVSYVPSPIAFDKYFVVISDDGLATCIEAKTGSHLWQQQLGKHHRPSPVMADGRMYALSDDGDMYVIKAGDKYELIAMNSMGEQFYASPAVSRGRILSALDGESVVRGAVGETYSPRRARRHEAVFEGRVDCPF